MEAAERWRLKKYLSGMYKDEVLRNKLKRSQRYCEEITKK